MALKVEIGGVDRSNQLDWGPGPVTYHTELNARPEASFYLLPDVFVDRYDEVVIYEDDETTPAWGGFVLARSVTGPEATERSLVSRVLVRCVGWIAYADYQYITAEYQSAVAAHDVIDDIVTAKLAAYGITYTPVDYGEVFDPFAWTRKRVSDALREVADRIGRVVVVTPDKELVLVVPGAASAPASITDAATNCESFVWYDEEDIPPNAITLVCGSGQQVATATFVTDGSGTEYSVGYPVSQNINDVWPAQLIVDGAPVRPVGWGPAQLPPGTNWYWDFTAGKLVNDTGTPLSAGHTITVTYTKQFPFEESDDLGVSPIVEEVVARPDITTREQAQGVLAALLAQSAGDAERAEFVTRVPGWGVGQALTVDITARGGIDAEFIVTRVGCDIYGAIRKYRVTAVNAAGYRRNFLDAWREVTGGGSAGSSTLALVSSGTGGGGGGGSAPSSSVVPWAPLGGARNTSIALNPADWAPVVNHADFVAAVTYAARVRVVIWARQAGVSVTARLRNVTDDTVVGTSDTVTSQTPTEKTFLVNIVAGKQYNLEIKAGTNGEGVYGIGWLEAVL